METQTDTSLMVQIQRGDTAKLAHLFERYHVPLFQYLLNLSRNRALSEDLVQEVFFRVLKYAAGYDPNFPFKTWLYRVAHNVYIDSVRKQRPEDGIGVIERFRSDEPMPEEVLTRKQDRMFLQEALNSLREDKRELLVLSRFHNLRYEDIANILNCELSTVKVRVHRALKELREKFCELRGEAVI